MSLYSFSSELDTNRFSITISHACLFFPLFQVETNGEKNSKISPASLFTVANTKTLLLFGAWSLLFGSNFLI